MRSTGCICNLKRTVMKLREVGVVKNYTSAFYTSALYTNAFYTNAFKNEFSSGANFA
jgi:hypothetical protein